MPLNLNLFKIIFTFFLALFQTIIYNYFHIIIYFQCPSLALFRHNTFTLKLLIFIPVLFHLSSLLGYLGNNTTYSIPNTFQALPSLLLTKTLGGFCYCLHFNNSQIKVWVTCPKPVSRQVMQLEFEAYWASLHSHLSLDLTVMSSLPIILQLI